MLRYFGSPLLSVPTVWIDTETTGTRPGTDKAVQVGIVRFDNGAPVASVETLINPGIPIPESATAIHGITNEQVDGKPTLEEFFSEQSTRQLLSDAQPAAYNAPFDRHFVPPFGVDWTWPWLDCLSIVRAVDRYVKGKGRHRLEVACQRHGVQLSKAHAAAADSEAAGVLFYKLIAGEFRDAHTLGGMLYWQRKQEADEWYRFSDWLSRQPAQENGRP